VGRIVLACVFLGACGFRPSAGTSTDARDAPGLDGDAPGTGSDGAMLTCMQRWYAKSPRFTAPVPLANVNSTSYDRDPYVTSDELTFYVSTSRGTSDGTSEIYSATRATPGDPFGTPALVPQLSPAGVSETKVSMTQNQLYAIVGSTKSGGAGGVDAWETMRGTVTGTFGALGRGHLMMVDTAANDHDPFVCHDGLHIYLAPDAPVQHIVVATRANTGANFPAPVPIVEITDPAGDADPALSLDERVIVFSSQRGGSGAGANVWFAVRDMITGGVFSTPVPVPDINGDGNDGDPHLSADGCTLYFASDRGGDYDVYVATMM